MTALAQDPGVGGVQHEAGSGERSQHTRRGVRIDRDPREGSRELIRQGGKARRTRSVQGTSAEQVQQDRVVDVRSPRHAGLGHLDRH